MQTRAWSTVAVAVLAVTIAGMFALWARPTAEPALEPLRIANIVPIVHGGALHVALDQGYFARHGLAVELVEYTSGRDALEAMLRGDAELAVSAETPLVHAVLAGAQPCVLAGLGGFGKFTGIVARRDRGVAAIGDLAGKTVAVTPHTNAELFLDSALLLHGVPRERVRVVVREPPWMSAALAAGEVDAVATWFPHVTLAAEALHGDAMVYTNDLLYEMKLVLSARRAFAMQRPQLVERVLAALARAVELIRERPAQARAIIARRVQLEPKLLDVAWAGYEFELELGQGLPEALELQALWALRKTGGDRPLPNFLDYICWQGLERVRPEAVDLIHGAAP